VSEDACSGGLGLLEERIGKVLSLGLCSYTELEKPAGYLK
jgi:hypothetical protein